MIVVLTVFVLITLALIFVQNTLVLAVLVLIIFVQITIVLNTFCSKNF